MQILRLTYVKFPPCTVQVGNYIMIVIIMIIMVDNDDINYNDNYINNDNSNNGSNDYQLIE